MATVYICDGCKKEINSFDAIRFFGSKSLHNIVFCQNCFKSIENYVASKYQINLESKPKNEQK